jgi:hypothetical protein
MVLFTFAFALVHAALFMWAIEASTTWPLATGAGREYLAAMLLGLPTAAAWMTAELVGFLRPPAVFDWRVRGARGLVVAGLAAGILSVVMSGAAMILGAVLKRELPEPAILGGSAALASAAMLVLFRRKRRQRCVRCDYDLSATVGPRCPECGSWYSRGLPERSGHSGA